MFFLLLSFPFLSSLFFDPQASDDLSFFYMKGVFFLYRGAVGLFLLPPVDYRSLFLRYSGRTLFLFII